MPDLYRPDGHNPRVGDKRKGVNANLLTEGISGATATRNTAARDKQQRKVSQGQSFEGRTWKTEQEMVMRQQYD
jgi:hypothetical protein